MSEILDVIAREILDSRGNPTVEVDVYLSTGDMGRASVPSGASTGQNEAIELRDSDAKRYRGKGVLNAVENVNATIAPQLVGMDVFDQVGIDNLLLEIDGTENKSKIGANATTGVSVAVARAASVFLGMPLYRYIGGAFAREIPVPLLNIINGGKHADNNVDLQEFMIMPIGAPNFREALRYAAETFHALRDILIKHGYATGVGDEGGFAPNLKSNAEPFELIVQAIEKAGYKPGEDVGIAIDAAASSFFKDGKYILASETDPERTTEEMIDFYEELMKKYPIVSIEDGLDENDWSGWKLMMDRLGSKIQIVGDDLFVTNSKFLKRGIEEKSANSILIKVNQIGTLTETVKTIEMARRAGFTYVFSHRSGETEDNWLADVAVGCTGSSRLRIQGAPGQVQPAHPHRGRARVRLGIQRQGRAVQHQVARGEKRGREKPPPFPAHHGETHPPFEKDHLHSPARLGRVHLAPGFTRRNPPRKDLHHGHLGSSWPKNRGQATLPSRPTPSCAVDSRLVTRIRSTGSTATIRSRPRSAITGSPGSATPRHGFSITCGPS